MSSSDARKRDHLTLCATGDVGFHARGPLFDDVSLVHDSLPELALAEVDLRVRIFGKRLRAPIVIAAMTGGTEEAARINLDLAAIAEARGYGFGLGSQRAMLRGVAPRLFKVRDVAPTTLVLGNLGGVQAAACSTEDVLGLVTAVSADALCVHLNPAQELIQPEGDRDFRGVLSALGRLSRDLPVPVVAKETGCGLGPSVARKLASAGVRHVDVSGAGGTSWVGVETLRMEGQDQQRALGEAFWDWGIPSAASVVMCARAEFSTVVATGGVSSGLDAARALALGAHAVGIARPVLRAHHEGGSAAVHRFFDGVEAELRTAMLLTGSRDVEALRRAPRIVGPTLARWIESP